MPGQYNGTSVREYKSGYDMNYGAAYPREMFYGESDRERMYRERYYHDCDRYNNERQVSKAAALQKEIADGLERSVKKANVEKDVVYEMIYRLQNSSPVSTNGMAVYVANRHDLDRDNVKKLNILVENQREIERLTKNRDALKQRLLDAVAWRYWSSLPVHDRYLLADRRLKNPEAVKLLASHAKLSDALVADYNSKFSSASIPDIEACLASTDIKPFSLAPQATTNNDRCPACSLLLRTCKRQCDDRKFIGCTSYPDCKFAWSPIWGVSYGTETMRIVSASEIKLAYFLTQLARKLTLLRSVATACNITPSTVLHDTGVLALNAWCAFFMQVESADMLGVCRDAIIEKAHMTPSEQQQFANLWNAWHELRRFEIHEHQKDAAPCTITVCDGKNNQTEQEQVVRKNMATNGISNVGGVCSTIINTVVSETTADGADAGWRSLAEEALEVGKPVVRQLVKETFGAGLTARKINAAMATPIGEGAIAWTMGWAIMGYGPLRGKSLGAKTLRLSKELRVRGLQPITDTIGRKFIRPISKRLAEMLENIPDFVNEPVS